MRRYLPKPLKRFVRNIIYFPLDFFESLTGQRDPLTPPRRIIYLGGDGDFKRIGNEFLNYFITLAGLEPHHKVLEVGSGVGRMAVPLTKYLSSGVYYGFDIVPEAVAWCRRAISARYANFHFELADIYNKHYNPKGRHKASEYVFPFEDSYFDFVFLTSVFTHMLPRDVDNYLGQISRVLKQGGSLLVTFFLINKESQVLMAQKRSRLDFRYDFGEYLSIDENVPERAVAYREEHVRDLFDKHGFALEEPIRYGSWCGRHKFLSYQDLVIARRISR